MPHYHGEFAKFLLKGTVVKHNMCLHVEHKNDQIEEYNYW